MKKALSAALALLFALCALALSGAPAAAKDGDWKLVELFPGAAKQPPKPLYFDIGSSYAPDMTTDINGNLYVMDGEKIVRFTPEGRLDTSWGKKGRCYLNLRKLYSECTDIVADSRGYVYATCMVCEDGGDIFLERFTPKGELDKSWFRDGINRGYNSNDEAEQQAPFYNGDIAVDARDNLYLYDGDKVYRLTPSGKKDSDWKGIKRGRTQDGIPLLDYLTIGGNHELYLYSQEGGYIERYGHDGKLVDKIVDAPEISRAVGEYGEIKVGPDGSFYSFDENENNILRFTPQGKPDASWCDNGVFTLPKVNGMASFINLFTLDSQGDMYIADGLGEIRKYAANGKLDTSWGKDGTLGNVDMIGGGVYHQVGELAADGLGNLYALDTPWGYGETHIYRYDKALKPDAKWNENASRYAGDFADSSLVVDEKGGLYVYTSDEAYRLKPDGTKDDTWKIKYDKDAYFVIVFAHNDFTYWIGDKGAVLRYDASGKSDAGWRYNGPFMFPQAADASGCIYGLGLYGIIYKATPQGRLDTTWCDKGQKRISEEDFAVGGITFDGADNLYVVDARNNKLQRYKSDGALDKSWCYNGQIDLPAVNEGYGGGLEGLTICNGRLYVLCDGRLYVLNDKLAGTAAAGSESGVLWLAALIVLTAGGVFMERRRAKRT